MIKKTLTYYDFNDQEVTEDAYFNLTSVELTRMSARYGGDLEGYINQVIADNDLMAMIDILEDLLLSSYGIKSEDGRRFIKTPEAVKDLEWSQGHAELLETLIKNPTETREFGIGLVLSARQQEELKDKIKELPVDPRTEV